MMHFIHLGDTHLGGSNFKLKERELDYLQSFKQVIDYIIKEEPGFVIHSGDLFDKGKPGNKVLLFTIKQLKRLKEKGIPFIIVPGSHDVSVDGTLITVLEKVGLLINAGKPENFEQQDDKFLMKGESVGDAVIYGVPGRRANIKQIYESISYEPSDKFKVFVFHHIISDVMGSESFADIPKSLLPKGMDYYAGGHWHEHAEFTYEGKPVIYPGSTDYCDINSMSNGVRGFIHYRDKPEFVELKNRLVSVIIVDCNGLNPTQVVDKALDQINKSEDGLLVLKLKGTLESGKRNEVDVQAIRTKALANGWLYCRVKLSDLMNPDELTINAGKSVKEVEQEFLKNKGYSSEEVLFAQQLIQLLGQDHSNTELSKAINEVIKLL